MAVKLGELLLQKNLITAEQLDEALKNQVILQWYFLLPLAYKVQNYKYQKRLATMNRLSLFLQFLKYR